MGDGFQYEMTIADEVVEIHLHGQLTAGNVTKFSDEVKTLVGTPIKKLIFNAQDLEYIASAGLRVIIFLKQKIGADADIYFIGGQEAVLEVIKMSGLDNFLRIQETNEE